MKKFVSFLIIMTILAGTGIPLGGLNNLNVYAAKVLDSFEEDTTALWHTEGGGSVERSIEYAKMGTYSLKWNFEKNSKLRIDNYDTFNMIKNTSNNHGIKLWIYNETPIDDQIVFRIGETSEVSGNPIYEFTYNLNFSGWRALWARVNNMAAKVSYSGRVPDAMEIVAPSGIEKGSLWLDMFEISDNVMYTAIADEQMPYIVFNNNSPHHLSKVSPKESLKPSLAAEYKREFDIMEKRVLEYITPSDVNYDVLPENDPLKIRYNATMAGIKSEINNYDKHGIKREADGRVTGPGLFAAMDYDYSPKFATFERAWVALALDYKINKNADSKRKILELFDFFNNQGWAAGSSCGSSNLDEINMDGYAYAVFLVKDELKEAGIFEREMETLKWRSEFGMIYDFDPMSPDYSVYIDKMRSVVVYQFLYILSQDDTPEKLRDMLAYTKYFEKVVSPRESHRGGIKPDYTTWHHIGPYMSAYGFQGLTGLTMIKYFINGTYFDIDDEASESIRNAVMIFEESSEGNAMHVGLGGRFPENNFNVMTGQMLPALGFMSLCGYRDMTEVFLKYWTNENVPLESFYKANLNRFVFVHTLGQIKLFQELEKEAKQKGYTPKGEDVLNQVYPYGSYGVHKRNGWMVTTKGFSRYIWDFEFGSGENMFGRYVSYGPTMIYLKEGAKASGIDIDAGWDWNRWPGATTKHLPLSELRGTGNNHRYYSDQTFLGGVSSENNGVFAMKIHDMLFDTSFRFNKSCFMFGDEVICLGSDIYCNDTENPIETTIFQSNMGNNTELSFNIDSPQPISDFPYSQSIDESAKVCITDPYGNSYILHDAKDLRIERGVQESMLKNGSKKSSGNYTTAWINHGTNPQGAGYEYVILPQKSYSDAQKLALNPDYEVLRRDTLGHIVKSSAYDSIGYAVFDTSLILSDGILKSSSVPCIAMETKKEDGKAIFTYCDPDLRMGNFTYIGQINNQNEILYVSKVNSAEVVLNGCWTFDGEKPDGVSIIRTDLKSDTTTMRFECVDGKQFECFLKRINTK